MTKEELLHKFRKLEKDERGIFHIHSSGMNMKQDYVSYCVDERAAETELEKLRVSLNGQSTLTSIKIGERMIYYNENIMIYRKISKIFKDLANVQQKNFYNKVEMGKGEGDIIRIANIVRGILEETIDTAYDLLQKFEVTDFQKEDFKFQYAKELKIDHEVFIAQFLKNIEQRLLECFKENDDAVILNCGAGRTDIYDPLQQSMVGVVYDLGGFKNNAEYMKLLDNTFQRTSLIKRYADFVFDQTIKIGKYVIEVLVQNQKLPPITHNYDIQLIYEGHLQKYLNNEISDDYFSDILWMILGEALDNEMVLSAIICFESVHDNSQKVALCQWNEEQGYYLKDTSQISVFYYAKMKASDFINHYDVALYNAQNEIEIQYYMKRYRTWYSNTAEDKVEEKHVSENKEYICEHCHTELQTVIKKLEQVEKKVAKEYEKIAEKKSCVDSCVKEHKWSEAIALIDGRCGYVELAIFYALKEQINYDKYKYQPGDQVKNIGLLLKNAQNVIFNADQAIERELNCVQGSEDVLKIIALNVLRTAYHYCFIQTEHFVLNLADRNVTGENAVEYKRWKKEYKAKREMTNLQILKQCETLIIQGANKGVALSCVLLLESFIPNKMNEQQKKMMCQVAAQRYCPEQMIKIGESILTSSAKTTEALEAYYWYLMAQKLTQKSESIEKAIIEIQGIVSRGI